MQVQLSELIDRYSILLLKKQRTDLEVENELRKYENELEKYGESINKYLIEIRSINGRIWDLESDIRKGKEKELGLEEVGRRAIKIRDLNKIRISIKNTITEKYNNGFIEVKKNHASGE